MGVYDRLTVNGEVSVCGGVPHALHRRAATATASPPHPGVDGKAGRPTDHHASRQEARGVRKN